MIFADFAGISQPIFMKFEKHYLLSWKLYWRILHSLKVSLPINVSEQLFSGSQPVNTYQPVGALVNPSFDGLSKYEIGIKLYIAIYAI